MSSARKQGRARFAVQEERDGWLFAAPFVVGALAFVVFPLAYSVALVFLEWDLVRPPAFVGLANIRKLFQDPMVGTSLYNTAYYTFLGVPLHLLVALTLALALNARARGVSAYRTAFYLPSITPSVASAVIWLQILHPEFGMLNDAFEKLGISPQRWLFEPSLTKPAFILMSLWSIGPQMVIFLAGLQAVPEVLYEAAHADGASAWQRFRHVTLPLLTPTIFFNIVVGIIASFQVFTTSFMMTGGGPQNATLFMVLQIYYVAFSYSRFGYASAIAWILFLIVAGFTVLQFYIGRRWVYYETQL
ncbi:MAG: sugar ABC transporter permease [Chloroflexi bacterium]|nr:sugar ABC transporter permease [Chloroflexota bacterium]